MAKSTALKVVTDDPKSDAELALETIEDEINREAFEAFYHIGQQLLRIKTKRLYEAAGFKSWGAYCASGRIEYSKTQSNYYIQASELRPKLAGIPGHEWTLEQLLALCKCATDKDAIRVAKKAIATAKKAKTRVTAKLIAKVRDGDDETGAASKRTAAGLDAVSLEKHLDKLATLLVEWRTSLEQIDLEQWEDLAPSTLMRVRAEAKALASFLRS